MPFKLPSLPLRDELVTSGKTATHRFQAWWQSIRASLETANNNIAENVSDIDDAVNDIADNVTAIATTQGNLVTALKLVIRNNSWVQGTSVLTAADVGADCTITIANHTRVYGNGSTLAITGAAITGAAFETLYAVYYDDSGWFDSSTLDVAASAEDAPTFVETTTIADAQFTAADSRFFVGYITTPADGGGGTGGGGGSPPGYGGGPIP